MTLRFWVHQILATSLVLTTLVACGTSASNVVPTAQIASPVATEVPAATATPQPTLEPTVIPTATNVVMPADLNVVPLVRGEVSKRPFVLMIDNHPDAYPQSGLNRASVVVEALAEYGITRFVAVFPGELASDERRIGPVRSARLYFVQWAMGFGAYYAHAGGSPTGLQLAESTDQIINLDALRDESTNYFFRVDTATRFAPHNLYTNGTLLQARAGVETTAFSRSDVGFRYRLALDVAERGAAQAFSYFFLYDDAPVGWKYDPISNNYLRTRFGKAATDEVSQAQLSTQNVVVIAVKEAPIAGDDKARIDQQVVGTGEGVLYRDGLREEVTWNKASPEAPIIFLDSNGEDVMFTAGQIWISAVPDLANISES